MAALARRFDEAFPGRPVLRIVNKIDLAAPRVEAEGFQPGEAVFTSAKTGEGVAAMFLALGRALWRRAGLLSG
jgi:50S ribosomal subunit-associated GTPase HflX